MTAEFIGSCFESLSQEEMDFVTGANGGVQPLVTPTVTISLSAAFSGFVGGTVSWTVGYTASAYVKCRD